MKLTDWQAKLEIYNRKVAEAAKILEDARYERDLFFKETLNMKAGDCATLEGTVAMIHKVIAMEREEVGG